MKSKAPTLPTAGTSPSFEPLLTVTDLERLLQLHRRTVSRLWRRGELPRPVRIGGSYRWRPKDIDQVLAERA
jgi:predicted DNA-binding transcriptional regulator AlpA